MVASINVIQRVANYLGRLLTSRSVLQFSSAFTLTDNPTTERTEVGLAASAGAVPLSRTIGTIAPIRIQGGLLDETDSADLSEDRTISILSASDSRSGSMSASHYTMLAQATSAPSPSTLVKRDVNGTMGRTRERARVTVSDANSTIDCAQGKTFKLRPAPAAVRSIELTQTGGNAPYEGETLELITEGALAAGQQYKVYREGQSGANTICELWGDEAGATCVWARFVCEAGVWRLDANSGGNVYDSTGPMIAGGVIPGPHA